MPKIFFKLEPIDNAPLEPRVLRTFTDPMLIGYMQRRACVQKLMLTVRSMPRRFRDGILSGTVGIEVDIPDAPDPADLENVRKLIQEDCDRLDALDQQTLDEEQKLLADVQSDTAEKSQPQPEGVAQ